MAQRIMETLAYVHSELALEILAMYAPELHLQNEFPDHPFFLTGRESAGHRQFAAIHRFDVWVPVVLVLIMRPVHMRNRGHPEPYHIGAGPQQVAIQKPGPRRIANRGIRTSHRVAGLFQLGKSIVDPAALGRPAGHRSYGLPKYLHVLDDGGVIRDLHLIDGDAVGSEPNGLTDTLTPVCFRLFHHSGNQVDIDLRKADGTGGLESLADLPRAMRAAVGIENTVVEVLDSQAQAGDAHLSQDLELATGNGSGLTLKGDLLGFIPGKLPLHRIDDAAELASGKKRWRATAEIDEARFSAADEWFSGVELEFADQGIQVAFDFGRILAGIDLEVAKMAAFPAKRNVNVDPQRSVGKWRTVQGRGSLAYVFMPPEGIRGVIGNKVTTGSGLFLQGRVCSNVHRDPLLALPSRFSGLNPTGSIAGQ